MFKTFFCVCLTVCLIFFPLTAQCKWLMSHKQLCNLVKCSSFHAKIIFFCFNSPNFTQYFKCFQVKNGSMSFHVCIWQAHASILVFQFWERCFFFSRAFSSNWSIAKDIWIWPNEASTTTKGHTLSYRTIWS